MRDFRNRCQRTIEKLAPSGIVTINRFLGEQPVDNPSQLSGNGRRPWLHVFANDRGQDFDRAEALARLPVAS